MQNVVEDGYESHRVRALEAAANGMTPAGAMLAASVPLELVDRMRKGYASNQTYRDRVDELLHATWLYIANMNVEVNTIRKAGMDTGRPMAVELRRARDIKYDLGELEDKLNDEQDALTGLAGMDESVISISLIKKRSSLHGIGEEETDER